MPRYRHDIHVFFAVGTFIRRDGLDNGVVMKVGCCIYQFNTIDSFNNGLDLCASAA